MTDITLTISTADLVGSIEIFDPSTGSVLRWAGTLDGLDGRAGA